MDKIQLILKWAIALWDWQMVKYNIKSLGKRSVCLDRRKILIIVSISSFYSALQGIFALH